MIKQLKKVGNSNAVILDKAIMELVGLEENDELQLSVHQGSIILLLAAQQLQQNARQSCGIDQTSYSTS